MEGAKPLIEGDGDLAIVALEVAMVQVVKERAGAQAELISDQHIIKTRMAFGRRERGVLGIKEHVDRVRRHNPVNQDHAEVEDVLHGMHGQAGPWPDVDIFVMQVVNIPIERFPVDQPMDPVEVEFTPEGDQAEPDDKIDRLGAPIDGRNQPVGIGPHKEHFISGPDRAATDATPEDVVVELITPQKHFAVGAFPRRVELPFGLLPFEGIEERVPPTRGQPEQGQIAQVHLRDPAHPKFCSARQIRLKIEPGDHRDQKVDRIVGPQKARKGEQPLQKLFRSWRPDKDRRVAQWVGRPPLPARRTEAIGCSLLAGLGL